MTFGGLAAKAGVSKSNLTVLFGDRQALQLAALEAAIARFIDVVVAPASGIASPARRLRALVENWFGYVERLTFPGGCALYATVHEYRARPGRLRDDILRYFDEWHRLLGATVRAAIETGEFRRDADPRETVCALTAYKHGAHVALLSGDRRSFEIMHRLSLRLLDSLAAPRSRRSRRTRASVAVRKAHG